ncbi:SPASM domain-containing protein [Desulfonatronum parangueonense]
MNIRKLLAWDGRHQLRTRLDEILEDARERAQNSGIALALPENHALLERRCPFIEQDAAFVDVAGRIAPCHFLWHRYGCVQDGVTRQVWPRRFGSLAESSLSEIWSREAFTAFRAESRTGEYPACASCNTGPCSDSRALSGPFQTDCLGSSVPCGHCPWAMGMLKCLEP